MKKIKKKLLISGLVTLLPMVFGLVMWNKLPDIMPTTIGFDGQITGTSSKTFAVIGLPLFLAATHVFVIFFTSKDPKIGNVSDKVMDLIYYICPVSSLFCGILIYSYTFDYKIPADIYGSLFTGLLFIIIGNYLPKCKQNYTVGIKLPWTLDNTENWNMTHRFAGKVWMIAGVLIILCGIMGYAVMMVTITLLASFIPIFYSYMHYVKYDSKEEK